MRSYKYIITVLSILAATNNCVSIDEYAKLQKEVNIIRAAQNKLEDKARKQDQQILGIAAQSNCPNNPRVREFIKTCSQSDQCPEEEVIPAVKAMRELPHVMLRTNYEKDSKSLQILPDGQTKVVELIRKHPIVPWFTKLLVLAISPYKNHNNIKSTKSKKYVTKNLNMSGFTQTEIGIDQPDLSRQARQLRNSMFGAPYQLDDKVLLLPEQVPMCGPRTSELVALFREIRENRLTPQEEKIQAPYVDLLIFLVEC